MGTEITLFLDTVFCCGARLGARRGGGARASVQISHAGSDVEVGLAVG